MGDQYVWLRLLHIFVAIVALGASAGLGLLLEFYGNDPVHGSFVLRAIERMVVLVVFPGYLLMLATGLWMADLAWSFTAGWIKLALGLWIVGMASLGWSLLALRKQRRLRATDSHGSVQYRRASIASRVSGGAFGLVVVAILYLMVFKP